MSVCFDDAVQCLAMWRYSRGESLTLSRDVYLGVACSVRAAKTVCRLHHIAFWAAKLLRVNPTNGKSDSITNQSHFVSFEGGTLTGSGGNFGLLIDAVNVCR
jgi:hypothetical protein